jgi:hypothetical protein
MDRWENEYLSNWQLEFEQYKKYQTYRRRDMLGEGGDGEGGEECPTVAAGGG